MADEPKAENPGGWQGLALGLVKLLNGLTNEKIMLTAILVVMGFVTYRALAGQTEREQNAMRMTEDGREKDRRHCDDREDKLQSFYAQQTDIQRKHDAAREERVAAKIVGLQEAVAALVAKVTGLEKLLQKP